MIDAVVVTSEFQKRTHIKFDEVTGLILEVGNFPDDKIDYYYNDDCLLFAGMGDVHIHAREDVSQKNIYKEDFLSAQKAMHNGGVTHAGDMPNNPIPPVDDESYNAKMQLAAKAQGEIWMYAGIGPETKPLSVKVPYKVYMGPSIGDLFFKDLKTLDETLKHYENQWVSFHCEDPEILESHTHEKHHHETRPIKAESVATKDALMLIEKYKLQGKLCHYSSKEGLDLVRAARNRGAKVMLEVTPQHLYFDMDSLSEEDYLPLQMNPPIRYRTDRTELLAAVKNGEIDFLATDHAPHTSEEKSHGHSGLTGLDTYGGFITWLIHQGVSPLTIAKISSENPGTFFNQFLPAWKKINPIYESFGHGLGFLKKHYRANFTVINLKKNLKVEKSWLKTKVNHSPFLGHEFPGQLEALFISGNKL